MAPRRHSPKKRAAYSTAARAAHAIHGATPRTLPARGEQIGADTLKAPFRESAGRRPAPLAQQVPLSIKYSYIPSELKRIGILAGIMLAVLLVLTRVLQ